MSILFLFLQGIYAPLSNDCGHIYHLKSSDTNMIQAEENKC